MEENVNIDLGYLFMKTLDGSITEQQFQTLNNQLLESRRAREYYLKYISTYTLLQQIDVSYCTDQPNDDDAELTYDKELWDMLARTEREAPEIEIPEEKSSHELIRKVIYPPREKRKVSKFSIVFLVMNAAAIFFILLFIKFPPTSGVEVATITSTINAKWEAKNDGMDIGTRLFSKSDPLWLKKGFAELTFDNNCRVTIEAPAEFEIVADDQIKLNYGRVYTVVPPQAIGFTISTLNAKVIDMGTEFAVLAGLDHETQLHVLKGKTMLISGSNKHSRETINVIEGQAKAIGSNNNVRDIPLQTRVFARRLYPESNFVWKGQPLDLADIVGGGNGLGTGQIDTGIDYNGHQATLNTFTSKKGPEGYIPLLSNSFIDGMFIPDGGNGPVVISSQGHLFEQCPDTNGKYWGGILNRTQHRSSTQEIPWHNLRLGSKIYDGKQNKAIYMHANQGITFDLKAIYQVIPNASILRFEATCGISDTLNDYKEQLRAYDYRTSKWTIVEPETTKADFYVLVDGQIRFSKIDMTIQDGGVDLSVEIYPEDRFLTLVTTQGFSDVWGNADDWTLFGEPRLSIVPK